MIIIVLVARQRGGETFEVKQERERAREQPKEAMCLFVCACVCVRVSMRGRSAGGMEIRTALRLHPLDM